MSGGRTKCHWKGGWLWRPAAAESGRPRRGAVPRFASCKGPARGTARATDVNYSSLLPSVWIGLCRPMKRVYVVLKSQIFIIFLCQELSSGDMSEACCACCKRVISLLPSFHSFIHSFIREIPAEHLLCARHSASCRGYSMNKPDTLCALLEFKVWQEKG